jgi:hypothetical protein
MIRDEDLLKSAKSGKSKTGKKDLINWLKGEKLTRGQAIKAKCYDCSGMGDSSHCDLQGCPLLPFSPYSPLEQRFRRAGRAKKGIVEGVANSKENS